LLDVSPETLAADNGSNFVGAQRELQKVYQLLDSSETQSSLDRFCATQNIKWTHSPARSPHFGGLWEAAVKSMKVLLYKVIGPHHLSVDIFFTLLVEIESVLNSRPLISFDCSPEDGTEVLTPRHFLFGNTLESIPTVVINRNVKLLRRWNWCQRLADGFWKRWVSEDVLHLKRMNKWTHPKRQVQVGI